MNKEYLELQIDDLLLVLETTHITDFGYIRSNMFVSNIVNKKRYTSFQIDLINSFFKAYCLSEYFPKHHYNGFRTLDKETKRKMMLESYFEIK